MPKPAPRHQLFDRAQETGQASVFQLVLPELGKSEGEWEDFYGRDGFDGVELSVCLLPKIAVQARQSPVQ
jgi:hypothetical protein